jgi:hypothetical protein
MKRHAMVRSKRRVSRPAKNAKPDRKVHYRRTKVISGKEVFKTTASALALTAMIELPVIVLGVLLASWH